MNAMYGKCEICGKHYQINSGSSALIDGVRYEGHVHCITSLMTDEPFRAEFFARKERERKVNLAVKDWWQKDNQGRQLTLGQLASELGVTTSEIKG